MKIKNIYMNAIMCIVALSAIPVRAMNSPALKEEIVSYTSEGTTMKGFVVYDTNIKGKRPAVLVVHEWWGLNDYIKMRARKLAELGYIAMAVDMYGDGKIANNPDEAKTMAGAFYGNPQLSKSRFEAAYNKIKEYSETDGNKIMAIGYCFGGSVVLNAAKLGVDLRGVVSFHGGLAGVPAKKELLKAKILVCHGGADKFVTDKDISNFKHELDSIGAQYTFKVYANATHAFTNPEATAIGKKFNMPIEYNAEGDKNSWNDMKNFFAQVLSK